MKDIGQKLDQFWALWDKKISTKNLWWSSKPYEHTKSFKKYVLNS